jgi:nucleotide-binding universal stress UspA family protein
VNTIVVGYDGSDAAKRALQRAAELAEAFGAKLTVVSVTEPIPIAGEPLVPGDAVGMGTVGAPAVPDTEESNRELEEAKRSLASRSIETEYVSTVGDAADAIVDAAESRSADMIVVGSRHPGFLDRLLAGDVGEAVSRRTRRDVLIVHEG